MIVKQASVNDIPNIVELLKLSLGESVVEKSQHIWNFKHIDNPFGKSHVLLATENDIFVGVRALMKWNWQVGNKVWIAYRAVDTATHPDYQGKGIFKKLTLQALDDVEEEQETFVFNTPNDKSRPGYLKMGWIIVDALPIAIVTTIPYFFLSILRKKVAKTHQIQREELDKLCKIHNRLLSGTNTIFTPKSAAYLKWRFEENPMQKYHVISTNDWYIAMYIKEHRFFKELRIVEVIGDDNNSHKAEVKNSVLDYAIQNRCWIITLANKDLFKLRLYGKFGPKLTFKSLTKDTLFVNKALNINNWKYSLGDLELF
jgi:GNAT superfamily N-acetyltransferase